MKIEVSAKALITASGAPPDTYYVVKWPDLGLTLFLLCASAYALAETGKYWHSRH